MNDRFQLLPLSVLDTFILPLQILLINLTNINSYIGLMVRYKRDKFIILSHKRHNSLSSIRSCPQPSM